MRYSVSAVAIGMLAIFSAGQANAQAGVRVVSDAQPSGIVGNNSQRARASIVCPDGAIMIGAEHAERDNTNDPVDIYGMSTRVGVYCANVNVTETSVSLERIGSGNVPYSRSPIQIEDFSPYPVNRVVSSLCANTETVARVGGTTRYQNVPSDKRNAWSTAIYIKCASLLFSGPTQGNWVSVSDQLKAKVQLGTQEVRNLVRYEDNGDYCGLNRYQITVGFATRGGGGGIDQLSFFCGNISQARFSSYITFEDYAWDRTIGSGGWLVNLNIGNTLLSGAGGISGANKVPYSDPQQNDPLRYQSGSEIFVFPNSNYTASASRRPAEVTAALNASAAFSGSCVTGLTLADREDNTCHLIVRGRPDIEVTTVNPSIYHLYNTNQNLTINLRNLGPRAVLATDQHAVTATLPAGWGAVDLPQACSLNGQVVRCLVPNMIAAASPSVVGGAAQFVIPIRATTSANGIFNVVVALDESQVDVSNHPARADFNATNNILDVPVQLLRNSNLIFEKTWVNAVVNDKSTLKAASSSAGEITFEATATQNDQVNTSDAVVVSPGHAYTLSEVFPDTNVGAYRAGSFSCTGGQLSGNVLVVRNEDSGNDIRCGITSTRVSTDVSVQKTLVTTPSNIRPNNDIVWRIVVSNSAGSEANGTVLRDVMGEGYDCSAVPPSCTATGGASCPANITAQSLADGITITQFPASSSLTLDVTCRVTSRGHEGGN